MLSSIEHCPCNFTWVSFQEVSFVASTIQEFERLQLQMQTLVNDMLDHTTQFKDTTKISIYIGKDKFYFSPYQNL